MLTHTHIQPQLFLTPLVDFFPASTGCIFHGGKSIHRVSEAGVWELKGDLERHNYPDSLKVSNSQTRRLDTYGFSPH